MKLFKQLNVIVGCEYSQAVTKAFRALGHNAYSCDIIECDGEYPQYHFQEDILELLERKQFDLGIFHPPCTFLCNSGVRWLWNSDGSRNEERWRNMQDGAMFFKQLLEHKSVNMKAIENPIMHRYAKEIIGAEQSQNIQPWMFGHGETKATCLWLQGLPKLIPTDIVEGREQRVWKLPPGPDRWKERSRTLPGIAEAMALQWSEHAMNANNSHDYIFKCAMEAS